ncbi:MAG: hypothetical protein ACC645_03505 [Pirellulales bacterium]
MVQNCPFCTIEESLIVAKNTTAIGFRDAYTLYASLSGGLGDLTDGVIATENWYIVEPPDGPNGPYVGWNHGNTPVISRIVKDQYPPPGPGTPVSLRRPGLSRPNCLVGQRPKMTQLHRMLSIRWLCSCSLTVSARIFPILRSVLSFALRACLARRKVSLGYCAASFSIISRSCFAEILGSLRVWRWPLWLGNPFYCREGYLAD